MRIVFAAPSTSKKELLELQVKNYLASYYNPSDIKAVIEIAKQIKECTLIIDSGAFSAWNKGKTINIANYRRFIMEFLKKNDSLFKEIYFVNLDVIPGSRGCIITKEMSEKSAKEGWGNYLYLKKEGVKNIIHVYHQGESVEWLKKMIDEGLEYIGISPSNDKQTSSRDEWLEYVFKFVPEKVKVHGFAVTSPRLMINYPWFSVDSATYNFLGAMGGFMYCDGNELEYRCYHLSERKDDLPKHEISRNKVREDLLKLDSRFTLEEISNSKNRFRERINIKTFLILEERINKKGYRNKHLQQDLLF